MTLEEAAAAVGLLPLHSAFQGPPTFSGQDATTDSIVNMIIDLNLPVSIFVNQALESLIARHLVGNTNRSAKRPRD